MSSNHRSSRRDFLQGRAAADLLAQAATGPCAADTAWPAPALSAPGLLSIYRRRAMACEFEVQLVADGQECAAEHALAALDLIEELEAKLTVYRTQSELLDINRHAAEEPVEIEPRLFALLELAQRLHRETGGAFDLTSGPLSEVWGFSRRAGRMPDDAELAAALARVGMDDVVLDAARRTVAFRRPGLSLHANSIGKGYALDRMAELLDTNGTGNYLLHGGRSSVLARGSCPGSNSGEQRAGWTIGVPHPLRPGERIAELSLVDQALGTSGSGTQFFEHAGRRYGHLLDPRTGRPVEGKYSITVVAPSAAEADALSTAFYIMEPAEIERFCQRRPELRVLLVCRGESLLDVQIWRFGEGENG